MYLWDSCYRDVEIPGTPDARSRLALYHALADHPSPRPSLDEVHAFEHDLALAREKLLRLRREVEPDEDEDIPFG